MDAAAVKRAGTLLFVGTGQFAFFLIIAEIEYPGYNVSANFISDLGATCASGACRFVQPSATIFDASIIVMGVLLWLSAYYLWKGAETRSLPAFMALAGVGAVGVGVFNESYGGVHTLFSAWTFVAAGIQALLVYKVAKQPYSAFSVLTGTVTLAATVLYGVHDYVGLGPGGMERVVVYPVLIGGIAFGGYLMALGDASRL